jgi:hypothetical protein
MKAPVVVEPLFGNTEKVARARRGRAGRVPRGGGRRGRRSSR